MLLKKLECGEYKCMQAWQKHGARSFCLFPEREQKFAAMIVQSAWKENNNM